MSYKKILQQAQETANEAKEIFADEDGDVEMAKDLIAEAERLKVRALGIKQSEEYEIEDEPADGVPTKKGDDLREQLLSGGFNENIVDATIGMLDKKGIDVGAYQKKPKESDNKSFGDFLRSVRYKDVKRLGSIYKAAKDRDTKDLTEGTGAAGGYLVPEEYLAELLMVPDSGAVVRPRARKIPMASRSLTMPMLDQGDTPGAYWKLDYYGGVLSYWTEETGTKTETEPAFKELELVAHKLAGYTQASDELLEDSAIGIESLLMDLFRGAIVMREEFGFLRGTGVGMPLGVLNSGSLLTQNRATANTIEYRDLARMMDQFLPASHANGVWVVDVTALPELLQMEDGAGNNVFVPNESGGVTQRIPGSIYGMPVVITEKLPTLGSTGDVLLADFSYYIIGDRKNTSIAASEHYAFTSDLTTWRFVHRVDGQPWLNEPIYIDTTNTVSPFVALHSSTTS